MRSRIFLMTLLLAAGTSPAMAQIANTASGSSTPSVVLLGNNAGGGQASVTGAPIQPYTSYNGAAASTASGPTFAELMSRNGQAMADTSTRLANERAQRVEAQMEQLRQQQAQQQGDTGGQAAGAQAPGPVVLQYNPPTESTSPARVFRVE